MRGFFFCSSPNTCMLNKRVFRADACPLGLQGVGLQPENLADARPLEALYALRTRSSKKTICGLSAGS